ncbi:MAG: hypothetical protein JEZ01_12375 [Labilibaculum sp.]|nr:hypothetical protein [Labilibaculum sp.]MBI9058551.1 hypothetical protein [Labilibaculum sp.]
MKSRIMYIELKSGQSDKGPAWIGKVDFSKSGNTIYFNGLAFKKMTGTAFAYSDSANYYDLENREGYWISGIKKNGQDRHWAGGGKIMIDRNIVDEYLKLVDFDTLDPNNFELVDIKPTDKKKFVELENQNIE